MRVALSLCLLLSVGCAPAIETRLAHDPDRAGAWSEDGPFGVGFFADSFRVRVSESTDVDVFVPLDDSGPAVTGAGFSPVLLLQGGLVDAARYHWLAIHIASRGHVVLMPRHLGNLAFFEASLGNEVLSAAREQAATGQGPLRGLNPSATALSMGHSLGGVVAVKNWLYDSSVSHLIMLAGIPDPADDVASRSDGFVLSLVGATDGRLTPGDVKDGADEFSAPTIAASIRGMNHFAFTDDNSADDLASDGPQEEDVFVTRTWAQYLIDGALADLDGEDSAALQSTDTWPEGIDPL